MELICLKVEEKNNTPAKKKKQNYDSLRQLNLL